MEKEQVVEWDGVRNYQAQNYMKIMKVSNLAFLYHTGKEKAILGIVEVFKLYYHVNDPKFELVNIKFLKPSDVK